MLRNRKSRGNPPRLRLAKLCPADPETYRRPLKAESLTLMLSAYRFPYAAFRFRRSRAPAMLNIRIAPTIAQGIMK